jgi:hypothetical protein
LTARLCKSRSSIRRNPNIEIAPSSGKDDVKRTAAWYANYMLCIALSVT